MNEQQQLSRQALREGVLAATSGNSMLARWHFDRSASLDPKNPSAWIWLAWSADSPQDSVGMVQRALELQPDSELAQCGLQWMQGLLGYLDTCQLDPDPSDTVLVAALQVHSAPTVQVGEPEQPAVESLDLASDEVPCPTTDGEDASDAYEFEHSAGGDYRQDPLNADASATKPRSDSDEDAVEDDAALLEDNFQNGSVETLDHEPTKESSERAVDQSSDQSFWQDDLDHLQGAPTIRWTASPASSHANVDSKVVPAEQVGKTDQSETKDDGPLADSDRDQGDASIESLMSAATVGPPPQDADAADNAPADSDDASDDALIEALMAAATVELPSRDFDAAEDAPHDSAHANDNDDAMIEALMSAATVELSSQDFDAAEDAPHDSAHANDNDDAMIEALMSAATVELPSQDFDAAEDAPHDSAHANDNDDAMIEALMSAATVELPSQDFDAAADAPHDSAHANDNDDAMIEALMSAATVELPSQDFDAAEDAPHDSADANDNDDAMIEALMSAATVELPTQDFDAAEDAPHDSADGSDNDDAMIEALMSAATIELAPQDAFEKEVTAGDVDADDDESLERLLNAPTTALGSLAEAEVSADDDGSEMDALLSALTLEMESPQNHGRDVQRVPSSERTESARQDHENADDTSQETAEDDPEWMSEPTQFVADSEQGSEPWSADERPCNPQDAWLTGPHDTPTVIAASECDEDTEEPQPELQAPPEEGDDALSSDLMCGDGLYIEDEGAFPWLRETQGADEGLAQNSAGDSPDDQPVFPPDNNSSPQRQASVPSYASDPFADDDLVESDEELIVVPAHWRSSEPSVADPKDASPDSSDCQEPSASEKRESSSGAEDVAADRSESREADVQSAIGDDLIVAEVVSSESTPTAQPSAASDAVKQTADNGQSWDWGFGEVGDMDSPTGPLDPNDGDLLAHQAAELHAAQSAEAAAHAHEHEQEHEQQRADHSQASELGGGSEAAPAGEAVQESALADPEEATLQSLVSQLDELEQLNEDTLRGAPGAASEQHSGLDEANSGSLDGAGRQSGSAGNVVVAVDDSPTMRNLITMTLELHGYQVATAADGLSGLNLIAQINPGLILMDINMPRLNGYKLCRLVRKHEKTQYVPVIMLSGKDGVFDKIRGTIAGCSDYISKPFEAADLIRKVSRYLPLTEDSPVCSAKAATK